MHKSSLPTLACADRRTTAPKITPSSLMTPHRHAVRVGLGIAAAATTVFFERAAGERRRIFYTVAAEL